MPARLCYSRTSLLLDPLMQTAVRSENGVPSARGMALGTRTPYLMKHRNSCFARSDHPLYSGSLSPCFARRPITEDSYISSGDDHDYCEYSHPLPFPSASGSTAAREITVKSFSMAMGIHRPGFQLLSLISRVPVMETLTQLPNSPPSLLDTPCFLPDQLGIYLNIYLPFILLSVLSLLAFNAHRTFAGGKTHTHRQPGVSPRPKHSERSPSRTNNDHELYQRSFGQSVSEDSDEDPMLPLPVTKPAGPAYSSKFRGRSSSSWVFYLPGRRRRISLSLPYSKANRRVHEVGLLRGFFSDMVGVAWPPLLAFCIAAWCTTHV